ncbi:hypothetical protein PG996_011476 [Apiospora saccharicola]|uniref:Uncharacterized protein n=1 Tax=Apiospora saccharicola TaxID=335842 RepID=A0ABR1UF54_9PEZI
MGGVAWLLVPGAPPQQQQPWEGVRKMDWAGVLTSSTAVVFLLIPISGGGAYFPWDSPMVISMLVIGVLSGSFTGSNQTDPNSNPTVEIFQNPVITIMLAQSFLMGAVYQSYLYYLPLYLQNARRYSVLESAAFTASLVAAQMVFSVAGGQYIARTKRYGEVIWFGFGSWTLGACLTLLYTATTPAGEADGVVVDGVLEASR